MCKDIQDARNKLHKVFMVYEHLKDFVVLVQ